MTSDCDTYDQARKHLTVNLRLVVKPGEPPSRMLAKRTKAHPNAKSMWHDVGYMFLLYVFSLSGGGWNLADVRLR